MKKIRFLSAFLTVVMLIGMLPTLNVAAAGTDEIVIGLDDNNQPLVDYVNQKWQGYGQKLSTMTKYLTKGDMELYVEPVTGEIALRNAVTDEILFSNPYDVATTKSSAATKRKLLSQIHIRYTDNDTEKDLWSFEEACQRGQITVKKIKGGVRVEYVIGRQETTKLVPMLIEKTRYEELIRANIPETDKKACGRFDAFYQLIDPYAEGISDRQKQEYLTNFPITEQFAVYVFDPTGTEKEKNEFEAYIKQYCPEYSYESLEEDHNMTGYEGNDRAPVLFRLALEYSLNDDGSLSVRLPVNSVRFDEKTYQLTYISILPYFGAGHVDYQGYSFIPDGSGTIIRFADVRGKNELTITGKLYGEDYAYQQIGGQHKEVMRMPVYGVVATNLKHANPGKAPKVDDARQCTGYLAIIEEGDSLASISANSGGQTHLYSSVYTTFSPRPKDTYNMAEAISVGENKTFTVVSKRKYTGNYSLRFYMLTEDSVAEEKGLKNYYESSYVGMAKAYRDYLKAEGILSDLTAETAKNGLPLYIESFGCIETMERVLSMPVEVLKPLTTFDDLKTMYDRLAESGITNLNFKLTGFANNGMNDTVPYKYKFEKAVGGNSGYTDLVKYANEKDFGIFPEVDFAYVTETEAFDGLTMRKHLIKTMDNRYTTKRIYSASLQDYKRGYDRAISPSCFAYFYDHFNNALQKLSPSGLSVATLGTDLNSDFDKKEPYNREDSKQFTTELLEKISNDYSEVMTEGGNAYALQYADHLLNVSLDSSRYISASEAVPFLGMVLHGSVNFAGTPINMAGDPKYEMLKAIENGSSLYFTLSMQNTSLLKEDIEFSKYYSVTFDTWYDEVVRLYNQLNEAIGDLQTKKITGHEFLIGERVPTDEEAEADKIAAELEAEELARLEEEERLKAERAAELQKRLEERDGVQTEPVETEPELDPEETVETEPIDEPVDPGVYQYTKYTSDDGRIVKVTYEGNKTFILNYNSFPVEVNDNGKVYKVEALGFVKEN